MPRWARYAPWPRTQAEAAGDVTTFYHDTLGVDPTATDLANCENALAAGQSLAAQQAFLRPNFAQSQTAANAISGLFQGVLGRPATQQDITCWEGQIQQGDSLAGIRLAFAQSSDAAKAVGGLFQDVLGRAATQQDLACWTGQLAQGGSLAEIRLAFAQSQDAADAIQSLFLNVLGRPATQQDLDYWTGQLGQGGSLAGIRLAFAQSSEATADIQGVYQIALGRAASSAELASARSALSSGQSLAGLAASLYSSAGEDLVNSPSTLTAIQGAFAPYLAGLDPATVQQVQSLVSDTLQTAITQAIQQAGGEGMRRRLPRPDRWG